MSIAQNPEQPKSNGKFQYEFVPNHGQWHPLVRYKANIPYGNLYLENAGMVYDLIHPDDYNRIQDWKHLHSAEQSDEVPRRHAIRMRFEGVKFAPRSESRKVQKHYYNYYLGNKKTNWASKVHPAGEVVFHNVYPDIDFEINGLKGLKYQWVINNPTQEKVKLIRTVIEGASNISIENNNLVIETTAGTLTDKEPYVYQQINGEIIALNAHYVVVDSVVSYEILSQINPDYPLVIDPELIFSTYSGSYGDNFGFTATYDSKANLYAGGIVDALQGAYPVTAGAYDASWNGGVGRRPANLASDISISKYDSAGTTLLWATYLGGGDDEYPHSLVVDRNDDLLIYGTSYSANFPYTTGCYDSTHAGGTDIIVSKLSEDGTRLIGSTFIGGEKNDGLNQNVNLKYNYSDDFRGDILTDDDGNLFVASVTLSDTMPLVNAYQSSKGSAYDGYLFSLSGDCKQMLWGTYLGGNGSDALYSIKLDQNKNIIIGGGTTSSDLPATDTGIRPVFIGVTDGVIAIFHKDSKVLKRLSYWGTESYDQIYFLDIDADNRIFATGQTEGNVIKSTNAYGESGRGQFVFRIDTLLQNIDIQTTFGNRDQSPNLTPSAFLVDVCDHIYFSGWGSSVDPNNHPGSTTGMPVSSDAVQKTTDGNDFYIIVLGRNAESLLYATYFGGDVTGDHVDGGTSRFDKKGVVYQSVCASCDLTGGSGKINDFPTTPGAAFEINESNSCSNASFKIDLQIRSAVISDFVAAPTIGCAPLGVQFTSTSVLGDSFHWDFGDGDTSTLLNPFHTFMEPGNYMVILTVIDSATCNILSTYKREIVVIASANAAFDVSFNACENKMSIENTSTNGFEYVWDFGDGTTSTKRDPEYAYNAVGAYTISLHVNPGTLCEDTVSKRLDILEDATPSIKLYNVFTPNGDGTNDCFKFDLEHRECTDYKLQIFNRWGERLFETSDPRVCWDGILPDDRHLAPEGTYFYIVYVGKNSEPISGIVELMK
jgi:gliding motility-associated-like protein